MKHLLIILLLFSFLSVSGQLPKDKQDHLMAGSLIGSWGAFLTINEKPLKSFCWSVGPAVVIGGGKELVYDKWMGQGTPEWKDFGWTVVGSVASYGIIRGLKWTVEKIDKRQNRKYKKNYAGYTE